MYVARIIFLHRKCATVHAQPPAPGGTTTDWHTPKGFKVVLFRNSASSVSFGDKNLVAFLITNVVVRVVVNVDLQDSDHVEGTKGRTRQYKIRVGEYWRKLTPLPSFYLILLPDLDAMVQRTATMQRFQVYTCITYCSGAVRVS